MFRCSVVSLVFSVSNLAWPGLLYMCLCVCELCPNWTAPTAQGSTCWGPCSPLHSRQDSPICWLLRSSKENVLCRKRRIAGRRRRAQCLLTDLVSSDRVRVWCQAQCLVSYSVSSDRLGVHCRAQYLVSDSVSSDRLGVEFNI